MALYAIISDELNRGELKIPSQVMLLFRRGSYDEAREKFDEDFSELVGVSLKGQRYMLAEIKTTKVVKED